MSDLASLGQLFEDAVKSLGGSVSKAMTEMPEAKNTPEKKPQIRPGKLAKEDYDILRKDISPGDVVAACKAISDNGITDGRFCWDFCFLAYYLAKCVPRGVYQDLHYTGHVCGEHHAGPSLISGIGVGDWLYINNQNTSDTNGNHSVIVVGVAGNGVFNVCSLWQPGQVPKYHQVNTNEPKGFVTYIGKPTVVSETHAFFDYIKKR